MDSVRSRDRVGQSTLMRHVIVFVGRLMMTVPGEGEGTLRLGRGEDRFLRVGKDRGLGGWETGLGYGI